MECIGNFGDKLFRIGQDFTVEVIARGGVQAKLREALKASGQLEQRASPLQPMLMMWLILHLPVFRSDSIPAVLGRLMGGLRGRFPQLPLEPMGDDALAHARIRIGVAPLRHLFQALGGTVRPEPSFHGYRLWSIDCVQMTMPDTPRNWAVFKPQRTSRGRAAFPRMRVAGLQDAVGRRFRDVRFGPLSTGERNLARPLLRHLSAGDLVSLDRGFYGAALLHQIRSRQAHFLVRVPSNVKLKAIAGTRKRDGDYIAEVQPDPTLPALRLRIIEYNMRGFGKVRLATSLLDLAIPAMDWILAYHRRWEIEMGFDEIKTHQSSYAGGTLKTIFRSKTPRGVVQEVYALFCSYNLIRETMALAAASHKIPTESLSFVGALRAIAHMLPRMRSAATDQLPHLYKQLLDDIAAQKLQRPRRSRRYPRVVKVKMSNYALKRPRHHQVFFDLSLIRIGA